MRADPLTLVQVMPPGDGGVRDYVDGLQAEWQRGGTPSTVIELSKALARTQPLVEQIEALMARRGHASSRLSVVLHYSGYGYGHRGLCFWLLDQIRHLRTRHRDALRLVVVFHELYASGPPWRSAFWLTSIQAGLAARLATTADALWTNSALHAQWLRTKVAAGTPLQVRPVFSNIGEPDHLPAWTTRRPEAVVFGSASTRQRAFDALRGHDAVLQGLGIDTLVEVGSGTTAGSATRLKRRQVGRLDTAALGQLLLTSQLGVLDYPSALLGKSGVLAAYAAHGCAVLNTRPAGADTDSLIAGRDYLTLQQGRLASDAPACSMPGDRLAALATRLSSWYAGHPLAGQAHDLLTMCRA
ncbi:MAG: hypothetical protein K2Q07_04990 [Burkholderiaceae bacterium]|nr:hypothetical protein [Burkholderiaceae bacterium]